MERVSDRRTDAGATAVSQPPYYLWAPEGKSTSVRLDFDVVDRLNTEVMRGLGAVPRRGAEVGGLLLGSIETGLHTVVHIRDFEPVPCEHKRGPSYLLSENDERTFADAVARWRSDDGRLQVVGYCRSHTRDGLSLAIEDLEILDKYFNLPGQVTLLIRPFATKVARAGFFLRENGIIDPVASPLEFPFRRKELGGASPSSTSRHLGLEDTQVSQPVENALAGLPAAPATDDPTPPSAARDILTSPEQVKRSWVWIPLSFVFLMLGVLIGFQVAMNGFRPAPVPPTASVDFSLGLQVSRTAGETIVTWNRAAAALRTASHGLLHIRDGNFYRAVDLRPADLKNGSVIIRRVSPAVELRLEVFQAPNLYVSESSIAPK